MPKPRCSACIASAAARPASQSAAFEWERPSKKDPRERHGELPEGVRTFEGTGEALERARAGDSAQLFSLLEWATCKLPSDTALTRLECAGAGRANDAGVAQAAAEGAAAEGAATGATVMGAAATGAAATKAVAMAGDAKVVGAGVAYAKACAAKAGRTARARVAVCLLYTSPSPRDS